jgi:hypothetical protein
MRTSADRGLVAAAICLALGVAAAGYFIGQTLYNSRTAVNTAEVKGLAERRVLADRAIWRIRYTVTGSDADAVADLYARSEQQKAEVITVLEASGLSGDEIRSGVVDYHRVEYRDNAQRLVDARRVLSGVVEVETSRVQRIAPARARLNDLIARGFDLANNPPSYLFTGLNDIKPEMVQEATTNARLAAGEFARNAGVSVGGIRSARQGNFVIRDAGSDYGSTEKIEKDIRVVTTITFYLDG